jgi:hypothetical protein
MSYENFLISVPGHACILLARMLFASIFICIGLDLFDFKKHNHFFTFKRVIGLFLLILGIRFLIDAILFLNII